MTSSNGNISRVTGPLCGEFTGPGEFPTQRPVTRIFDVFFDMRLNKWLSKQPWGRWFETPSWSLWRQYNAYTGNTGKTASLYWDVFNENVLLIGPLGTLLKWTWNSNQHTELFIQENAFAWWRHQMETVSALLALCEGNPPVTGGFPSQRPVTRSIDVSFDVRLNKGLSKQSRRRWFETPSRPLWRHCNVKMSANWCLFCPGLFSWHYFLEQKWALPL